MGTNEKFVVRSIINRTQRTVTINTDTPWGGLYRILADTKERRLRAGMIKLGWLPPCGDVTLSDIADLTGNYLRNFFLRWVR